MSTKKQLIDGLRATAARCRELVETPQVNGDIRDAVRRLSMLAEQGAGEIVALIEQVTCLEEALKPSQEAVQTKKTTTQGKKKGDDSKG